MPSKQALPIICHVLQSELQAQTAEINWKQAKSNRFPDLNGSIGHGINQGRSIDPFTNSLY